MQLVDCAPSRQMEISCKPRVLSASALATNMTTFKVCSQFLRRFLFLAAVASCFPPRVEAQNPPPPPKPFQAITNGADERDYLVHVLVRIAEPVLTGMAAGKLELPAHDWERDRVQFAKLEALGRTLAGISPWLELGPDQTEEG